MVSSIGSAARRLVALERLGLVELGFAFQRGLLSETEIVGIELDRLNAGVGVTAAEERIALALPDESEAVAEFLTTIEVSGDDEARSIDLWMFVQLQEIRDRCSAGDQCLEQVAELVDRMNWPAGFERLVYYWRVPRGERPPGREGLIERLDGYLERARARLGED